MMTVCYTFISWPGLSTRHCITQDHTRKCPFIQFQIPPILFFVNYSTTSEGKTRLTYEQKLAFESRGRPYTASYWVGFNRGWYQTPRAYSMITNQTHELLWSQHMNGEVFESLQRSSTLNLHHLCNNRDWRKIYSIRIEEEFWSSIM